MISWLIKEVVFMAISFSIMDVFYFDSETNSTEKMVFTRHHFFRKVNIM